MSKTRQKVQAETSLFWVSLRLDTDNIDVWNYRTVYVRYAGFGRWPTTAFVHSPAACVANYAQARKRRSTTFFSRGGVPPPPPRARAPRMDPPLSSLVLVVVLMIMDNKLKHVWIAYVECCSCMGQLIGLSHFSRLESVISQRLPSQHIFSWLFPWLEIATPDCRISLDGTAPCLATMKSSSAWLQQTSS